MDVLGGLHAPGSLRREQEEKTEKAGKMNKAGKTEKAEKAEKAVETERMEKMRKMESGPAPADLRISDLMALQMELWEQHKEKWSPMEPAYGKDFFLWMMEEIGECIAVLKKKGGEAVMEEAEVRAAFVEELSDVLMYYVDILLRYGVTAEEISRAFAEKHARNMGRDFQKEYRSLYNAGSSEKENTAGR